MAVVALLLLWRFGISEFAQFLLEPKPTHAASNGPRDPTIVANDASTGVMMWLNPENATSSNNAHASATLLANQQSQYLKATGFGFALPSSALITGIRVEVERSATQNAAAVDHAVRIVKGGVIQATDRSSSTNWPVADAYRSYGGSSDLWGESWSAADINDAGFGFAISSRALLGATVNIDHIRITVFYNAPPAIVSFSDSPDQVNVGSPITLTLEWSDADSGELVKAHFCKTNEITPSASGGSCPGGAWADSSSLTSANPISLNYVTQDADRPIITYFAFVCDDGSLCSSATSNAGTTGITKPATANQVPSVVSFDASPNPVTVTSTLTFTLDWSDPDAGEKAKIHFCRTNAITASPTGGSCPGGAWVSSANLTSSDPKQEQYTVQTADAPTITYFAFVCDAGSLCSPPTANTGAITVQAPASGTSPPTPTPTESPPESKPEEAEETPERKFLNAQTSVASGSSFTVLFQTRKALTGTNRPVLNVYDPVFRQRVFSQPMDESNTPGIYQTGVTFDAAWGTGIFTLTAADSIEAVRPAFTLAVTPAEGSSYTQTPSLRVSLPASPAEAVRRVDTLLGHIESVTVSVSVRAEIDTGALQVVIQELHAMLEQGRKTPGLVAFLSEGKRHLEEEVKVAEGTEKVREAKNLLNEVAAVGRTAKKVFEGARSIISETFWTTGSVTLNLLVTNPVGSGERTLSVKASLPEGITAAHVLELPADLTVEQDSSGDFSFVTGAVSLPEGESRKVKVNLEDIWQIPEKELENLESTTQQYYQTPLGTNFSSQALVLKDNILKNLEELVLKQINAITPEEKVAAHKRNLQILETARKDLKELEALVKQYRRTQTLRIAMMVGAALLLGLLFFLFWRRLGSAVEGVAAKSEALSMASHQLRSPLTALQWILETLKRKLGNKLSAEEKEFLEKAYGSSTRMMGMISDFLSASKLEVGKLIVESKPTDLKEIAKSVLEELQPTISSRKLAVEEEYAKDLSVIQSDPQLIRVIFQNLLTNAVRYTKKGKIRLEVSRREGVVKIVVTDTGCGIPLNQQAKIFTKLFRADNARELEREGTGLGLYLVKRVVERLGGKIGFTSEENRGTTFNVRLPA